MPIRFRFFVNGIEAEVVPQTEIDPEIDPEIPVIAARFGLPGPPEAYSFSASLPVERLGVVRSLRIEFRPGSGLELAPYQDWYVPLKIGRQADAMRRLRVSSTPDAGMFEATGLSNSRTIRRAFSEYFGRDYRDCGAILDWGCGCGRIARFIAEEAPGKLIGIDIDPDNIDWCAQNIRDAQSHTIGLNPPTAFAAETFDLVYGISVFTHLSEADQDIWLAELQRLTRPGSAILMSIHGDIAFCRADADIHRFLDLQERGFQTYGLNNALDDVVPEAKATAYYRNVFHSRRYIYERWGNFLEILDVIDAAISGHQDLVIVRRR